MYEQAFADYQEMPISLVSITNIEKKWGKVWKKNLEQKERMKYEIRGRKREIMEKLDPVVRMIVEKMGYESMS